MAGEIYLDADKAAAERCRREGGLAFFVKEFWDIIVPNPLVWNWHMQVLCDEVQASDELVFKRLPKLYDLLFNVPPGTSKTLILSVLSTAWEFARMPGIKVFVGSFSDAAVAGIADQIKVVMKSSKYQKWFPHTIIRKDRDSLHNFKTTANGEFYAFTVGGTLTSKHADILKIDDPLNPKQAASEAELEAANHFFSKTLPTRKVDKKVTPIYLIMQRLAMNDPSGVMLEKKGAAVRHICLPGELSKMVKPAQYAKYYVDGLLDPQRLTRKDLAELMIDLGPDGYAGQIGQTPVPEGGLIWKKEYFIIVPDYDMPDPKWGEAYGSDWDTAYTKDEVNAASAFITSFRYRHKIYLDDFGFRWLEFPEMIKWMKQQISPHHIEKKASGKSAKQTLTERGVVAIEVPVPGGADKIARAKMATPVGAAGMLCIRQSIAERFFNDSRQGVLFFPKGQYADVADVLAQVVARHKGGGTRVMGDAEDLQDEFDELEELDY
jgi:phage terminase large subunit-like protein